MDKLVDKRLRQPAAHVEFRSPVRYDDFFSISMQLAFVSVTYRMALS